MKKKILSAVISGILMVSTITCVVPEMTVIAQAATTYGTVNGNNVNIRQSASTSSKSLGKLNKGVRVEILSSTNGWYRIKWGNITGYISAQYVTKDSASPKETAFIKAGYVKVQTNLNVRKSASTSSASLGKLTNGTKVDIVAQTTDKKWYKIKYNGGYGYVSCDYITDKKPVQPNNPDKLTDAQKSQLRKEIIARAQAMVDMEWTAPCDFTSWSSTKNTYFKKGKKYKGMPYTQLTQMSSPADFNNKIKSYKSEDWSSKVTTRHGNTYYCPKYGNDCSGFVSFALGLKRLDTSALATNTYTTKIDKKDLQPGDILDYAGHHTFMFKKWADANHTKMVVLEQTEPKATENTKSVSSLGNYQARRLNKLV